MGDKVFAFGAPPFPFGAVDWQTPFAWLLYSGVDPLNLGSYEGLAYLLSGSPFDASLQTTFVGPPFPFGDLDWQTTLQFAAKGAIATIYPAATIARSSAPDDVPPNLYIPAKYQIGFNYAVSLFTGADPTSAGSATIGVLQLVDPDGELDGLLSLGWDGAPLQISRGDPATPFSTWAVVANVSAAGMLYDQQKKEIQLRDLGWLLNAAPLHGQYYGGTGGVDGDLVLLGKIKPYAIGHFFNVTPVQIGAALLCYQIHIAAVASIVAKDGGNALTLDADDPDYASLAAATIGVGHYRTCLALGLFRLGGAPLLIITADGVGESATLNGHGAPATRAQIARRIVTGYGVLKLDDGSQIDGNSYATLENSQPAPCGWYWDVAITKGAALSEVMAGCMGWWLMRLGGQLAFGQVEDPATATPYLTLSFPAPDAGEVRVGEPAMTEYKTQRRATYIGWSRNYTPMQTNQIAGVLDQITQAVLMAPTRYAASIDLFVANSYPTSPTVQLDGGFAFQVDAQVEADRQQALMRIRREPYKLDVIMDPLADVVGRVLNIANFNRLGFGISKNEFCYGISASNGPAVTLQMWG